MEIFARITVAGLFILGTCLGVFAYWRYAWFFRNPPRRTPTGPNVVSPADGTVVYVEKISPSRPVICIKQGHSVSVNEIVKEDLEHTKVIIGVFMSPFDVHYNRAPISGKIDLIRHHPAKRKNLHMGRMHLRTLFKRLPLYANSLHIVENERTVTMIRGSFKETPIACYVVQIAGGSVSGIDQFFHEGQDLEKGEIFGMIRIGSQVDLVVTWNDSMKILVNPGDRVRAGETIFIA
ncbi:phosphatidylserine decarboxylase [Desulfatiglans anilini]|uniref:phosphatidylserine decarboxylase n=1 Tax=Desulfatiglans anilini TaxID=90728 RepID=UPI0004201CF5|nr:phosphatidylserine decarboxylase [Desulfatiglans anilini]